MNRVMIVDDAAVARLTLKAILEKLECTVVGEADNGISAIKKYRELHPDIVTMDITMPELDGIGAVKEIMAFDPKAKIIMVSAMGQKLMVIDAIQAGAKGFIVKPFKEEAIASALKTLKSMS
ncbi:MAG: response regulator [Clostridia bacterium]|nr:response regulator [Clostridia bacterium]